MKGLAPVLLCLFVAGCSKPVPASPETPPEPATAVKAPAGGGEGKETIQPMVPGAGPMSPVAGTDSVQGAGNATGTGDVAKQRARGIQNKVNGVGTQPEPTPDSGQ